MTSIAMTHGTLQEAVRFVSDTWMVNHAISSVPLVAPNTVGRVWQAAETMRQLARAV